MGGGKLRGKVNEMSNLAMAEAGEAVGSCSSLADLHAY